METGATVVPGSSVKPGILLCAERRSRNLLQKDVRKQLGWSNDKIVDIERGRQEPTAAEVKDYHAALSRLQMERGN